MNNDALIIAIANRKGGTGKTTTSVNLAALWGMQGYKTLLIDLDTQGHSAIGLGCRALRQTDVNIHKIYSDTAVTLTDVITETKIANVWIAPADTDFCQQNIDVYRLKKVILENSDNFQRIIIDTPPTLDRLLINALVVAQGIIVPFVPHHLAEVGVKQLAKLFYEVATRYNPNLKLFGLLPVMFDKHIKLHQRVIAILEKQFGQNRIFSGIRTNIRLAEAFEAGEPISHFSPKCVGCIDYKLMLTELEQLFIEKE